MKSLFKIGIFVGFISFTAIVSPIVSAYRYEHYSSLVSIVWEWVWMLLFGGILYLFSIKGSVSISIDYLRLGGAIILIFLALLKYIVVLPDFSYYVGIESMAIAKISIGYMLFSSLFHSQCPQNK